MRLANTQIESCRAQSIERNFEITERGIALPAALLLLLVIATATAMLTRGATDHMRLAKSQEVSQNLFLVAEGAIHDQMRQMVLQPEAWKQLPPIELSPADYNAYQPANYAIQNGIPDCSGMGCMRRLYPVGGGILKNIGPLSAEGSSVNQSVTIDEQYDPENTPSQADVYLSDLNAFAQIERLDRVVTPSDATGANLSTSGNVLGNAESVRFRVTGYASKELKGVRGEAVVVAVIEMPAV